MRDSAVRIAIVDESHNRVDWETRSPLLWIEGGLGVAALFFALLVVPSPSPYRWLALGAVVGVLVLLAVILAITTPLVDQGSLERLPEGGDLQRLKVWLLRGPRPAVEADLGEVARFEAETEIFEDSPLDIYQLSRLWAIFKDGERRCLTDWCEPASVAALGDALSRAGRLPFAAPDL